ncbi:histidine kinase [Nocardiopsis gilva YIM 90087]|uniref:Histidine kinase n=2 Tax=Nocardiopsis gilva TaxID=280236 RepID=A0A223SEB9_9ACTN|nr:histidine kinase [Nocardiopsis gilva YIM 90087]
MPYVDNLRRQLVVAAEAGNEDARAVAERLAAALEPAARLALLDALSEAADEITRDFAPGSVEVRLRGGQTDFIVTPPPTDEPVDGPSDGGLASPRPSSGEAAAEAGPVAESQPHDAEDGGTSRVTLRLPVHLKPQVEEAARREGLSVNAWLVRAVAAGLDTGARRPDRGAGRQVGRGYTGWVR